MKSRFQFRLRTLCVVVTLFAIPRAYVGWQAKIVRARQNWLKAHPSYCAASLMAPDRGARPEDPSFVRVCLGDEAIGGIGVEDQYAAEARELFPEAAVDAYPSPSTSPR
jgi:hypothetical protein